MNYDTFKGLLLIALIAGIIYLSGASGRRKRRLEKLGITANATFVSARQTGTRTGANYVLTITLDVQQRDGSLYRCVTRSTVDAGWSLRPGDQVKVFLNPQNRDEVVLDKSTPPVYAAQNVPPPHEPTVT